MRSQSEELAAVRLDVLRENLIRAKAEHRHAMQELEFQQARVANTAALIRQAAEALDRAHMSLADSERPSMCDPHNDPSAYLQGGAM
jgi:hypothetical protein